jgi:hypothetical protein
LRILCSNHNKLESIRMLGQSSSPHTTKKHDIGNEVSWETVSQKGISKGLQTITQP